MGALPALKDFTTPVHPDDALLHYTPPMRPSSHPEIHIMKNHLLGCAATSKSLSGALCTAPTTTPPFQTRTLALALLLALWAASSPGIQAGELVHAKDGSGVYGYDDTPKLPWCGYLVHDANRPAPTRIKPGEPSRGTQTGTAPSDAVVLFDGKDLDRWETTNWRLVDGCIEAVGDTTLTTKQAFGDMQLHLEFQVPNPPSGPWYNRGNNGVYIMGLYEIQIFDSYTEKIYPDGQTAAIYGQTPPLVNACLPPGEWQTYDILFQAPVFAGDKLAQPARVTLLHNGVLVQWNEEIHGETGHRVLPEYRQKISQAPLKLGGHGCPVRFRNIWIRPQAASPKAMSKP